MADFRRREGQHAPLPAAFDRIALEARQQPGAYERGLATAGGAEDRQEALARVAQPGDQGITLALAAAENRRFLRLERAQAGIRRARPSRFGYPPGLGVCACGPLRLPAALLEPRLDQFF